MKFLKLFLGIEKIKTLDFRSIKIEEDYFNNTPEFYEKLKEKALETELFRITCLKRAVTLARFLSIPFILIGILLYLDPADLFKNTLSPEQIEELKKWLTIIEGTLPMIPFFPYYEFKTHVKDNLFKNIISLLGDFRYQHYGNRDLESYKIFKIIPSYYKRAHSSSEDWIAGSYKNVKISFEEVVLEKETRYSVKTAFSGILLILDFNKKFFGRTIIKSQKGFIKNYSEGDFAGLKLEEVSLEDPEFAKMFMVYSENQIEARYLITTSFMERLKALNSFFDSDKVEASFYDNRLLLAFDSKIDLFEPSSIFEPIKLIEETRKISTQLKLIFDVIDTLKVNEKIWLQ